MYGRPDAKAKRDEARRKNAEGPTVMWLWSPGFDELIARISVRREHVFQQSGASGKKRMDERRNSIGERSCLTGEISLVMGWASPTLMAACRGLSKWDALEHCRMRRKAAEGQTKYRSDGSVNMAKVTHTRPKQYGWLLVAEDCHAQG